MELKDFSMRLSRLRINKGVSAREMSLSIGQSEGYISNIESGVNFPSMSVFFFICEYLGVTPSEFFDTDSKNPIREQELLNTVKGLGTEQLDHLIAIARAFKK